MSAQKLAIVAGILLVAYLYLRRSLAAVASIPQTTYALPTAAVNSDTTLPAGTAEGPPVEARSGIGHFVVPPPEGAPTVLPGGTDLDGQSVAILRTTSGTIYTAGPSTEAKSGRGHF